MQYAQGDGGEDRGGEETGVAQGEEEGVCSGGS